MYADEFEEPVRPVKRMDAAAIQVLKEHVAQQGGEQGDGLVIDRSFVVVEPAPHPT